MKLFITGSNGFIGGRIAELAGQRAGIFPICGYRQSKGVVRIARVPLELSQCDITSKDSLRDAIQSDVEVLIHCASGTPGTLAAGCQNVAEVVAEKNIKKLIFISSVDVYGNQEGEISERTERQETNSWYTLEKIAAERYLESLDGAIDEIIILRPSIVYGPFCVPWLIRYYERAALGSGLQVPEEYNGTCNLVYVDDLAELILDVAGMKSKKGVSVFNVSGPEVFQWNDYFKLLEEIMGYEVGAVGTQRDGFMKASIRKVAKYGLKHHRERINWLRLNLPYGKRIFGSVESGLRKSFDEVEAAVYRRKPVYSIDKARTELRYEPEVRVSRGVQFCEEYLRYYHSEWT